ncbi:MAG: hypothetical protein QM398_11950 [Thermoproteota archaeon]|nr:hypothetical protein [Thermoproteota archaeon]
MGFIDNEMAKRIGEWIEKNPERANGYFKEARELSDQFINKKISFDEYEKQIFQLKEKYGYGEKW